MIIGLNHVGMSVLDLDVQTDFYRALAGFDVVDRFSFSDYEPADRVSELSDVSVDAAMLSGPNFFLEMFRFNRPDPGRIEPNRTIVTAGINHISMTTGDIDADYRRLSTRGVRFHAGQSETTGGVRTVHGRDPEGNLINIEEQTDHQSNGIARLDHVGISTPNFSRLLEFYTETIGLPLDGTIATQPLPDSGSVANDVDTCLETARLAAGNTHLELVGYPQVGTEVIYPNRPVSALGFNHICLEVDDVDAEHERLLVAGMRFHCDPLDLSPGQRLTYGRDPDGNAIEIWQGELSTGVCLASLGE